MQTVDVWVGRRGARLVTEGGTLLEIKLLEGKGKTKMPAGLPREIVKLAEDMTSYFSGKGKGFRFKPPAVGTPFHRRVYQALCKVPAGQVVTYGELAMISGRPGAARAVGTAMAKNPFAILVPCHRVVASDGGLGGYGYGLDWKRFLLNLEGVRL
jgi:methylated-DNA-[protein]-cysteine S-methyltransferase